MTRPFQKPENIAPPAPCWIVRRPPSGRPSELDTIEIVFVGHMLREELDSRVERLLRWPWHFGPDERGAGVSILADTHADPIGVRLTSDAITLTNVVALVADLFGAELVCQALSPRENAAMHRKG